MIYEGIRHKCGYNDCYCLNDDELRICLHANRSVSNAVLMCEDPYIGGISEAWAWDGKPVAMSVSLELSHEIIFSATVRPVYKRLQYYFRITFDDGTEKCLLEDGLHDPSFVNRRDLALNFYKFGWMNESDIMKPPRWAADTVWYQIFPDRFNRIPDGRPDKFEDWDNISVRNHKCRYGGNIKGVLKRLPYLASLGITGIYFTPIFLSQTSHRYDTTDYELVDPDFGTNEEFAALVRKAHDLGIRIMIDAVFNHSGKDFFAWQDVVRNGKSSPYFNWYYIRSADFTKQGNTMDGRYYSFAFVSEMPKLNTNNPEVRNYLTAVCRKWLREFNIDGIRFDVGNEISHSFIRHLSTELKREKPDLFLLGEIWTDASPYLEGGEYDSVMNYPFLHAVGNFFRDSALTADDFRHMVSYCYSLYREQVNEVLFNLLDSHDVSRLMSRAGSCDTFMQQLVILMTMPGTPCIYYGTEIALEGTGDPDNRRPMPWKDIDSGKFREITAKIAQLIAIRKEPGFSSSVPLNWENSAGNRILHYSRGESRRHHVCINAGTDDIALPLEGDVLFRHGYEERILKKGGAVIMRISQ